VEYGALEEVIGLLTSKQHKVEEREDQIDTTGIHKIELTYTTDMVRKVILYL
jgi:hypothetical protein